MFNIELIKLIRCQSENVIKLRKIEFNIELVRLIRFQSENVIKLRKIKLFKCQIKR